MRSKNAPAAGGTANRGSATAGGNSSLSVSDRSTDQELPFIRLYVGDRLREMATWPGESCGLYLQLIVLSWAGGALPHNDTALALLTRRELKQFRAAWAPIRGKFVHDGAGLVLPWLEDLRVASLREVSARRDAAAKTNAKRAERRAERDGERSGQRDVDRHDERSGERHADRDAFHSQKSESQEEEKRPLKGANGSADHAEGTALELAAEGRS